MLNILITFFCLYLLIVVEKMVAA